MITVGWVMVRALHASHLRVTVLSLTRQPPLEGNHSSDGVTAKRREFLKQVPQQAPSTSGKPKDFAQQQMNDKTAIYCGCPGQREGAVPATLLHPVFGRFLDNARTLQPTEADNALALELSITLAEFYMDELT
jgi:hypothetical protein